MSCMTVEILRITVITDKKYVDNKAEMSIFILNDSDNEIVQERH